ncbi:MAG: 30S ribosomal protein S14 [Pseudomonadota bacterium]
MAKKSIIEREKKRIKTVAKYEKKRQHIKALIASYTKDPEANHEQLIEAYTQLQKLPRNASPTRVRNRCRITGRPRGYYRKFGLSRNMLRILAMFGKIPGVVKSSW